MKKAILAASVVLVVCLGSSQIPRFRVATPEIRLQAADAAAPALELLGTWPYGPCEACAIDAGRKLALIGNGETLQVLDISNTSQPAKIGEVSLEGNPQDIEISGNFAYVMTLNYLLVVSVADPAHPSILAGFLYSGTSSGPWPCRRDRAYVAAEYTLDIFDVSDPYHPAHLGTYRHDGSDFYDIVVWGTYAICTYSHWRWPDPATRTYGLEVVDVSVAYGSSPRRKPRLGKEFPLPRSCRDGRRARPRLLFRGNIEERRARRHRRRLRPRPSVGIGTPRPERTADSTGSPSWGTSPSFTRARRGG